MNKPLERQWTERMSTWGIFRYINTVMDVVFKVVGNYRVGYPMIDDGSIVIPINETGQHLADLHMDHHHGTMRYHLDNEAMDQAEADNLLERIDIALRRELDGVILDWPRPMEEGRDE